MADVSGDNHAERVFWCERNHLRYFTTTPTENEKILAEYIRSDVVADMVSMTYTEKERE